MAFHRALLSAPVGTNSEVPIQSFDCKLGTSWSNPYNKVYPQLLIQTHDQTFQTWPHSERAMDAKQDHVSLLHNNSGNVLHQLPAVNVSGRPGAAKLLFHVALFIYSAQSLLTAILDVLHTGQHLTQ